MSRRAIRSAAFFFVILFGTAWSSATQASTEQKTPPAETEIDKSPPKGMTADEVVRRFTAREKQWKQVREQYTFQQSVKIQALDGEDVRGEYRQVAQISYQNGQRNKSVIFGPQASLDMSPQDTQDVESRSSFTISTDELPLYDVKYVGQQKVDELHCYVFDVAPKQMEKDKRYFQGRIWVDDQDFQIVKNAGKSVPDIKIKKRKRVEENLFPQFTTYRQYIDGYWFPTFSSADDTLHFTSSDMRIKQVIKFTDYKKGGGQQGAADRR
jgi:hypothetical protein